VQAHPQPASSRSTEAVVLTIACSLRRLIGAHFLDEAQHNPYKTMTLMTMWRAGPRWRMKPIQDQQQITRGS